MNIAKQEAEKDMPEALTLQWWRTLQERKGDRAQLCRSRALEQIYLVPAYHRMLLSLKGTAWTRRDHLALVCGVLAHIREDDRRLSLAARLAGPRERGSSKPRFSGLRFRRLIQHTQPDEVFEPMVRAVLQVGRAADIPALARDLYWWNERTRRDWAFAYYEANPAAE